MSNRIPVMAGTLALALLALATAAQAVSPSFYQGSFGARDLRMGDRGTDVKTLNWALRAGALGAPRHGTFSGSTDRAVRALQRTAGLRTNGVVARRTRKAVAGRMVRQRE
jgi:peptidoglycan hydrolase-like protein with peptidoglycan-binding domain